MSSFISSNSLRSWAISAWLSGIGRDVAMRRSPTNARMMPRFTFIAAGDLNTLLSMATPNSVKANAVYLLPPQLEVPLWHLKIGLFQHRMPLLNRSRASRAGRESHKSCFGLFECHS